MSRTFRVTCPSCASLHFPAGVWQPWCLSCLSQLQPWPEEACPGCGKPQAQGGLCGECSERSGPFTLSRHLYAYDGVMQEMIHAYKFHFWFHLADAFALSLAMALPWFSPDFKGAPLVPIPSHPLRILRHRFDPVHTVTKRTARVSGHPFAPILRKVDHTPAQSTLTAAERRNLTASVYRTKTRIYPTRAILVDDVATTLSTARAAARAIKRDGVHEVALITLSRTP